MAALEVLPAGSPAVLERTERQKPPHDLTDEEVEVWAAIVDSEPADWFSPATVPILAQLCRHVVQSRRIAEMIERATADKNLEIRDYNRLLAMQDRESRAIALMATKLRITQQSTINQRGNHKPSAARKPWEG